MEGSEISVAARDAGLSLHYRNSADADAYVDTLELTVNLMIKKIALGGAASCSNQMVAKVYVPTKWGGQLTLSGGQVELFYTDGADLTTETANQILRGELDVHRVAQGSPCVYEVPENHFKLTGTRL